MAVSYRNKNMSSQEPKSLPSFSAWLASQLGFQLPTIPLPQTLKNFDKAAARLISAGGENLATRIDRRTAMEVAKTDAETRMIHDSSSILSKLIGTDDDITSRALTFTFHDSVLKQKNREGILRIAVGDLEDNSETNDAATEIGDDWLNAFSDLAANKTNHDIQSLWGRILAGEIRSPGSFSLQSLHRLSVIDSNQANLIHRILANVVNDEYVFLPTHNDDLLICEDLGVVTGSTGTLTKQQAYVSGKQRTYRLPHVTILSCSSSDKTIHVTAALLTRFGTELYRLSHNYGQDDGYIQEFVEFLENHGFLVSKEPTPQTFPNG